MLPPQRRVLTLPDHASTQPARSSYSSEPRLHRAQPSRTLNGLKKAEIHDVGARERQQCGRRTSELAGLGQTSLALSQSLHKYDILIMRGMVDEKLVSCVDDGGEAQSVGVNASVCSGLCHILLI